MSFAFLVSTLLIAQGVSTQLIQTDRDREELKGQVYAVRHTVRHVNEASGKLEELTTHTTDYYDKEGNLTLSLVYAEGRAVTRKTYIHNGSGETVEKVDTARGAENQ